MEHAFFQPGYMFLSNYFEIPCIYTCIYDILLLKNVSGLKSNNITEDWAPALQRLTSTRISTF